METKICTKCGEEKKPLVGAKRRWFRCRRCGEEYRRKWRKKNPEKAREYERRSKEKNREKVMEYNRKWREKNREHIREYQRRRDPEKKRTSSMASKKRAADELRDWYIKDRIRRTVAVRSPPQELIKSTRQLLKNKRLIKQKKNG